MNFKKRRIHKLIFLFAVCCSFIINMDNASANTATCGIKPPATDISTPPDDQPNPNRPPEGVVLYVYSGVRGTDYTVSCTVDTEPIMVVLTGADMKSWSYASDTKTVTVNLNHVGFLEGVQDFGPVDPFGVAFVWAASEQDRESGPPAEMKGGWMSTNVMQWNMIPPSKETPSFGFELSGPSGKEGFFHMFVPDALLTLLSSLLGRTLSATDLAVFNDNKQASVAVTQVAGGVSVVLNVLFNSSSTEVHEYPNSTTYRPAAAKAFDVSKKMTLASKLPLSMAAQKNSLKKNGNASLYGWLGNGKAASKITVLAKRPGAKIFQSIRVMKTKNNGAYSLRFKCTKTGKYFFKAVSGKLKSPVQTVNVR